MPKYVAFLRAINVGGHVVKMDRLRQPFVDLGFKSVETFIASGNVIFEPPVLGIGTLEAKIAARLEEALGYEVATFIRTLGEVAAIAACRPFTPEDLAGAAAFNVALLKDALSKEKEKALGGLKTSVDDFRVKGAEVYWLCRARQSESKFSNAVFERTLRVQATFRSMRTMERLAVKYPAQASRTTRFT